MLFFNYSNVIDPIFRKTRQFLADFIKVEKGQKVLDVCCGTAAQLILYSKKGAVGYGVDLNEGMLELAKKNLEKNNIDNVFLQRASVQQLPFEKGFFDAASICLGLHEMNEENRKAAVAEMTRVVKKDGVIVLTDFMVPFPKSFAGLFLRSVEYLAGKQNYSCFSDYLAKGGLDPLIVGQKLKREEEKISFLNLLSIVKTKNINEL